MPAGRPRLHPNHAEKQFAYRQRQIDERQEERQLSERAKGLLLVAASRGMVLNVEEPLWAQMDELERWLKSH